MSDESAQDNRFGATALLVSVYLLLIVFAFFGAYKFTDWNHKDALNSFAAVATVGITAVSALLGVVISFISLNRNQHSADTLERLRSDLQVKVLSQKIWTDLSFEHKKMKAAAEHTAYVKLWTSADYAYRLLATLETASWTPKDKLLMDNALLEAHPQLVYMRDPEHQVVWKKTRQRARFISEEAGKLAANAQPSLWTREAADFANLCRQFELIANTEINRAPSET